MAACRAGFFFCKHPHVAGHLHTGRSFSLLALCSYHSEPLLPPACAQAHVTALPPEVWSEAYQAQHSAVVGGRSRSGNVDKYKPGVKSM